LAFDNPHGFEIVGPVNPNFIVEIPIESLATVYINDVVIESTTDAGEIIRMPDDSSSSDIVGISLGYGVGNAGGTVVVPVYVNAHNVLLRCQTETGWSGTAANVFDYYQIATGTPSGTYSDQELGDADGTGQFQLMAFVEGAEAGGGLLTTGANAEVLVRIVIADTIYS
jgi:hypothetical protein